MQLGSPMTPSPRSAHMASMTYTPMPNHLDQQLQAVVEEIRTNHTDAGNIVFVVRNALAQAYAAGHKDGHGQATSHRWITDGLAKKLTDRNKKRDVPSTEQQDGSGA